MGSSFLLAVIKGKRKKRRRSSQAPEIPMDLVMEILTRLPAKSLMRFKCVSKLCSSLICSLYFSKRFLTVSSRPHPRLYMSLWDLKDCRNSVILSLAPGTSTMSSFVVSHDLTIPRMEGYIWQNLCGFMCYEFSAKAHIFNPATRQLVTLPAVKPDLKLYPRRQVVSVISYYFGQDPVNNRYKVICSIGKATTSKILSEHWVFDLKPGGSWKKVTPNVADLCSHFPVKRALSVNGVIYYLAWIDYYNAMVVSFDIRSEEFRMIPVPRKDGDELPAKVKNLSLLEYSGKVTIFDQTSLRDKGMVKLWVVEDAGNKEWSRKTLVLQPSQQHLVNNIELKLTCPTQNGKVLLIPPDLISPFYFLCYDVQNNDMRKIEIKGIPDQWFSELETKRILNLMFMDHGESVMYLET